jgi:hypothetical protein
VAEFVLNPLLYLVIAHSLTGQLLLGLAMQRGSTNAAVAGMDAAGAIPAAIIGLLFLGDQMRPALEWLAASGFVVTLGAVIALTRFAEPQHELVAEPGPASLPLALRLVPWAARPPGARRGRGTRGRGGLRRVAHPRHHRATAPAVAPAAGPRERRLERFGERSCLRARVAAAPNGALAALAAEAADGVLAAAAPLSANGLHTNGLHANGNGVHANGNGVHANGNGNGAHTNGNGAHANGHEPARKLLPDRRAAPLSHHR